MLARKLMDALQFLHGTVMLNEAEVLWILFLLFFLHEIKEDSLVFAE